MKEFTYTIKEPVGIHARPAGMLAKEAKTCQSTVTIVDKNGKSVDATRLMALMGMGIKCGDTVTVKIEGADEETAAPAMEKFFNALYANKYNNFVRRKATRSTIFLNLLSLIFYL